MLAPRPSRIVVRTVVVAAGSIGLVVGAASSAIADVVTTDTAVQTVPAKTEAPASFEWD